MVRWAEDTINAITPVPVGYVLGLPLCFMG